MKRQIIQISDNCALCNDGTYWAYDGNKWTRSAGIPQDADTMPPPVAEKTVLASEIAKWRDVTIASAQGLKSTELNAYYGVRFTVLANILNGAK